MIGKIDFPEGITYNIRYVSGGDFLAKDFNKITDTSYMYSYSPAAMIKVGFDTSNVMNMNQMFYNCLKLSGVNKFDTSNVTNMYSMFQGCNSLTSIPELDTSNVTNMSSMFYGCTSLKSLPNFNCVKVANFGAGAYSSWLYNCTSLESIGVVDCESITNIGYALGNKENNNLKHLGGFRNLGKASSVSNTNSGYFLVYAPNLTYESVMNVLNLLYDRAANGLSNLTLKLHSNHMAMLSDDDVAIATNKGWTLTV